MTPINVDELSGLPAPYWFIQLFKVLGFILHSIPMHLWLVGLPIGLFLLMIGGVNAKTFAKRLLKQLPVIMAFGVNLGIVPLLFIQVAYYKVFYPATIFMAWHWFGILLLVLPAYYLLYITSGLVDAGHKWRPILTGTVASLLLVGTGLIFASAWSLMAAPETWPELWREKSVAAAATGLASNWRDPVVFLRFISIFGLAIMTVTFWALFDAWFLFAEKKGGKKRATAPAAEPVKTTPAAYSLSPAKPKPAQTSVSDFMDNPYLPAKRKKKLKKLRDAGKLSEELELKAMEYGFNGETSDADDDEPNEKPVKRERKPRAAADDDPSDAGSYRRWVLNFTSSLVWFGVFVAAGSLWFYYFKVLTPDAAAVTETPETASVSAPLSPVPQSAPLPATPVNRPPAGNVPLTPAVRRTAGETTTVTMTPEGGDGSAVATADSPTRLFPGWLPYVTFTSIGIFAVILTLGWFRLIRGRLLVAILGLFEIITLTFFAVTRQAIQNAQIGSYLDLKSMPVRTQLSPLLVFILIFLLGAGLIVWMIFAMAKTVKK